MKKWQKTLLGLCCSSALLLSACTSQDNGSTPNQTGLDQLQLPTDKSSDSPSASESTHPDTALPAAEVRNQLVWKIKPAGAEAPVSYLLGTVHAPFAKDYQPPEAFYQALDQAQVFLMEADVDKAAEAINSETAKALDQNQNLETLMGSDDFQLLQTTLTSSGTFPENLTPALPYLRPWFISLFLSSPPMPRPWIPKKSWMWSCSAVPSPKALRCNTWSPRPSNYSNCKKSPQTKWFDC